MTTYWAKLNINDDVLIIAGDNVLDFSLCKFIEYAKEDIKLIPITLEDGCGYNSTGFFVVWCCTKSIQ